MNTIRSTILVTGATGKQGGAVGVEVVRGDFDDIASLDVALAGVSGAFSMQTPTHPEDTDTETRTRKALVEAACRAGVSPIVHTSVARAGDHERFIG